MFQPETEDMLPRMAPKPSPNVISGSSEAIIRPQVPEVSILFGQQDPNFQQKTFNNPLQQQKIDYPQQTYAAWKKQMLPKVTFPANMADTQLQENNMVMTGYNCTTTNINPILLNNNPALHIGPSAHMFGNRNGCGEMVNQLTYRRSLENCNKANPPIQNFPSLNQFPNSRSEGVLTICAGTQTDENFESANNIFHSQSEFLSNLATKKDVENVQQILDEVRVEQQRILKLLEAILLSRHSQMSTKTHYLSIGVQVDLNDMGNPAFLNGDTDFFPNHQSVPKNKFVEHLKPNNNNILQSPKGKPIAQSTTYRPNSPKFQNLKHDLAPSPVYQEPIKPTLKISKSASDTSLAMNELALKYLPNEKLAELLNELNMDCPIIAAEKNEPTTPNRGNFDKFEKGPSDISNASYKYLKKYRLLPEDHEENRKNACEGVMCNDIENHLPQYNSPQYNAKNSPINQRQTPANKCSPYPYAAGRLPLSPLARTSPTSAQSTSPQHVDLDNIKQQPKFL